MRVFFSTTPDIYWSTSWYVIFILTGWNPDQFLPDLGLLLSSDTMGSLSTDKQTQYLLGAVYELVNTVVQ